MNTRTKNPSTLSADFLFKPIGLVYHTHYACISSPKVHIISRRLHLAFAIDFDTF